MYNLYELYLSTIVHCIKYLAQMSYLSELIDILDDDEVLHSTDSTAGVGYRSVGVASTYCLI